MRRVSLCSDDRDVSATLVFNDLAMMIAMKTEPSQIHFHRTSLPGRCSAALRGIGCDAFKRQPVVAHSTCFPWDECLMTRFEFPLRWPVLVSMALMVWVASFSHEFTHHLTASVVCGDVGRMSLNRFVLAGGCTGPWPVSTAAGPVLSYLMMWLGAWMVRRGRKPLLGLALVVAYVPFLRLLTAAMGGGDEGVLMRLWSPVHARWMAPVLVLALVLPPLLVCYRSLANRRRGSVFLAAFLLPILPVLPIPAADSAWYGDWLAGTVALPHLFGVPFAVLMVHGSLLACCLLALVWFRPGVWHGVTMPANETRAPSHDSEPRLSAGTS